MNTPSSPSNQQAAKPSTQLASNLPILLASADKIAAEAVQHLGLVKQARVAQLTRVATTATAQYGAGSTQATAAQSEVTATQISVSRIAVVHQQATTPEPPVTKAGWALHGRVYDSNLKPLTSYSVFLVDGQKNYLSVYGYAYTDNTGYFQINYPGSLAVGSANKVNEKGTTEPFQQAASAGDLYLQVVNDKAEPVYLSATAFQPRVGSATYQVVTLAAGEPKLGDLPAAVRTVAMPKPKNKP